MITNQEWERLEILLDFKLEQKLEQKLDEKLDKKLDEKFGEFAILMKNVFDDIHQRIDESMRRLENHDYRIYRLENDVSEIKKEI